MLSVCKGIHKADGRREGGRKGGRKGEILFVVKDYRSTGAQLRLGLAMPQRKAEAVSPLMI
jgi:hypothetical protein